MNFHHIFEEGLITQNTEVNTYNNLFELNSYSFESTNQHYVTNFDFIHWFFNSFDRNQTLLKNYTNIGSTVPPRIVSFAFLIFPGKPDHFFSNGSSLAPKATPNDRGATISFRYGCSPQPSTNLTN